MPVIEYDLFLPNGDPEQLKRSLDFEIPSERVVTQIHSTSGWEKRGLLMIADLETPPHRLVAEITQARAQGASLAGVTLLEHYQPPKHVDLILVRDFLADAFPDLYPFIPVELASLQKIISAHLNGGRDRRIASVKLVDDELLVWSCEPKPYRCLVSQIKPLAALEREQWHEFELNRSGTCLSWEEFDIDINLDTIRYAADAEFRAQQDQQRQQELLRYGQGITMLRQAHQLGLDECGISESELRQIESGELMPSSALLRALATAHNMSLSNYLGSVAQAIPVEAD